ncbi:ABC transporter substrate-binding protein [Streptomyces sp. LX-29]|uniref:ABC transporter substrate-binding protein n=1 Tax=Streptomyces sp. LX-29 TaxID=2900152 RepID=UPI00240E625E|nr:ABC transporter substrate-binding protein [Streptomyces sp. LX-29]WFB07281.1 ABC transporter substrate-binding protein [Streptomyces sp. LX-29]
MTIPSSRATRRLAAGIAVAALLAGAAACSGDNGRNKNGDGSGGGGGGGKDGGFNAANSKILNPSTEAGGTLKFISTQDADFWDPQRGYYGFMWDFSRFYTRQLVTYAPKPGKGGQDIVPDLATERAKVTNDGKTYTYTLRDDLFYEDGSKITSQDIKYGIERIFATDVINGGPPYLMQILDNGQKYKGPYKDKAKDKLGLKSIQTPDEKTIIFNLPEPNSDFEGILALPTSTPVPPKQDKGAKYTLRPFSSGPYKFKTYDPGKKLVLERNTAWKKSSDPVRAALPDEVTVDFTTNADDADAKLLDGTYHLNLTQRGVQQAARVKILRDADLKANTDDPLTGFIRYVAMPQSVEPFNNVHCRRAVIYASDKTTLLASRGGKYGGEIGINMLPPTISGHDASSDPYGMRAGGGKPQQDKARDELKQCGKPGGFKTKVAVRQNEPAEVASAEALQDALGKVGITVDIDKFDGAQGNAVIGSPNNVQKQGYGLIIYGWGADFNSGAGFLQPLVDSRFLLDSGNNNYTEVKDKKIDALFDKAIAESDPAKAAETYKELNQRVSDLALYVPFVYDKTLNYRSPELTNVYTSEGFNGKVDFVSLGVKGGDK